MKQNEIKVGSTYTAKVSNKLTTVRVDAIRETRTGVTRRDVFHYDVTNLATGRKTTFRSAAKFRSEVKPIQVPTGTLKAAEKKFLEAAGHNIEVV